MISISCQSSSSTCSTSWRISESVCSRLAGRSSSVSSPMLLEEKGHRLVERVALGQEQQPVELFVFGAVELQLDGLAAVEAREVDVGGMVEDLGAAFSLRVAQDAVAVVEVAVQLHVANGGEAVEPGVGDGFHGGVEAVELDALDELLAEARATDFGKAWPPTSSTSPCTSAGSMRFARDPVAGPPAPSPRR